MECEFRISGHSQKSGDFEIIQEKLTTYSQGRINHLANRANARGLALLGASGLNIKTLPFLVFHVFRLFNVHQNCRAF